MSNKCWSVHGALWNIEMKASSVVVSGNQGMRHLKVFKEKYSMVSLRDFVGE